MSHEMGMHNRKGCGNTIQQTLAECVQHNVLDVAEYTKVYLPMKLVIPL